MVLGTVLGLLLPIALLDALLCLLHTHLKPLVVVHASRAPLRPPSPCAAAAPRARSACERVLGASPFRPTSVRWFQLHSACNWILVALTWSEFYELCAAGDRAAALVHAPSTNVVALHLATALHLYHALFWPLKPIDVLHHVTSVVLCAPLMLCMDSKLLSWHIVVGTGVPGGIDYALLTLVKYRWLPPIVEKRVNAWLNAFVRAPLGVVGSYLTLGYARTAWGEGGRGAQAAAAAAIATITYWNATYFAKRSIESYGAAAAAAAEARHRPV